MRQILILLIILTFGFAEENLCKEYANKAVNFYLNKDKWTQSDYDEVLNYLNNHSNNPACAGGIGEMYANGYGVDINYTIAYNWYKKSADGSHPLGMTGIGWLYDSGYYLEQNYTKAYEWYLKAAEQNNSIAQNNLGLLYQEGLGVEQDYAKAYEWYLKAAEQNNSAAQNNIGVLYEYGLGIEQNYTKAYEWYLKAANQGNIGGQNNIGILYEEGLGVEQDYAKAYEWYLKAAKQGNSNTQNRIGYLYQHGLGIEQDYAKSYEWYLKAAKQGYSIAQNNIGYIYIKGLGVEKNYAKAYEWYLKAAKQGYASAQYSIGYLYQEGLGIEQDYAKSYEWYLKAAKQGDGSAQRLIGYFYQEGLEVEQDYGKAYEWYLKASEQGDSTAQNNIGILYEKGLGVEQDYTKACEWYLKAAEQGDATAQNNLGMLYFNGLGVEQDYVKAYNWLLKSSEKGNNYALYNIGRFYEEGLGVEQNYMKAYEWYLKAAKQGYFLAQNDIGYFYENGLGVEQNYEKAYDWYLQAANQGYAPAQNSIGEFYGSALGVEQDYEKAMEWFLKSAEQGYAKAQYNIAILYDEGLGVEEDNYKAWEWLLKAGKQGYIEAQKRIGYLYFDGTIIKQNYTQSFIWYLRAAYQGDVTSQKNIGYFYENGLGVKKDYTKAYEWYLEAANQRDDYAQNKVEELSKIFLPTQVVKNENINLSDTILKSCSYGGNIFSTSFSFASIGTYSLNCEFEWNGEDENITLTIKVIDKKIESIKSEGSGNIYDLSESVAIRENFTSMKLNGEFSENAKVIVTPSIVSDKIIGNLQSNGKIKDILINKNYLLVAKGNEGGAILNLNNSEIFKFNLDGYSNALATNGKVIFGALGEKGLLISTNEDNYLSLNGFAYDVEIYKKLALVATNEGLNIVNIEDIKNPYIQDRIEGSYFKVKVDKNIAYILSDESLMTLNLDFFVRYSINLSAKDLMIDGNLLYTIGEEFNIYDISNWEEPTLLDSLDIKGNALAIRDNLAYIGDGEKLKIVDLKTKELKSILNTKPSGFNHSFINAILLQDNLAYLANDEAGVTILDIGYSQSSTILKSIQIDKGSKVNSILQNGETLLIADSKVGLSILNLNDLTIEKKIDLNSENIKSIKVNNNLAYISKGEDGISIVDLKNYEILSSTHTNGVANNLAIKGDFAYVADSKGITILDISNPKTPYFWREAIATNGVASDIAIKDNTLYIADGVAGLSLFDLTNLKTPTLIESISTNGFANSLLLKDDLAYVTSSTSLVIIDLNSKKVIKTIDLGVSANRVFIKDSIAYVATSNEVTLIDLTTYEIIENLELNEEVRDIAVIDGRVFVATKELQIFELILDTKIESLKSNEIDFIFPNYSILGKYDIKVVDKNSSKLKEAILLEDKSILDSISKNRDMQLKVVGEPKEYYKVGESVNIVGIYKDDDENYHNVFNNIFEFNAISSNEKIASIFGNRVNFKSSGEVTISIKAKTQEGLLKFKVVDENGTFEKNENPLDMIIVVGRDSEEKKLEKAFIKNGNDLYLFALSLTDSENIKYFNSILKEQVLADIDESFGKDNVVLNKIVNFENIKDAIENMPYSTTPLLIHILGHGSNDLGGKVMLEEGYLPAEGLKIVLNDYQNVTNREVIIVVDACYSGAFAQSLESKEFKRLIITSVNETESAIMAPLDGTSYSKYLKEYFGLGNTMGISFDEASQIYRNLVNRSLSPTIKGDELLQNFKVPNPKISSGLSEVFLNYTSSESVNLNETKELFVKIKLSEFERKTLIDNAIYAKIIPPQEINLNVGEFEIPTIEIEKVILKEVESDSESVTYKSYYSFDKEGIYSIAFAIENNMQNTIETTPIKIEVGKESKDIATLTIEEKINESDNFILKRGWNLVTSPIKEGIEVKELNITSIWSYKNGKWENSIDKIEPYRGYFINADTNQSYKFGGINYKINFDNLENGWNLVGSGDRVYKYEFEGVDKVFSYDENWTSGESEYFHYLEKAKGVWIKK